MKILIGENIKRLRKSKNITQEELSNLFNVTPAAVCKWETGETYPDITLLFPLANYFGVTIDELMGYDEQKIEEEIRELTENYWKILWQDQEKARELITNAYHKYPGNYLIMHMYMWNKAGDMADNNPKVLLDNKEEFLSICEKILNGSNDEFLRLNTWNMKAKIMHAEGKTEEALKIYDEKYPNFYHTSNQKKEQLFSKDTKEFDYFLSINMFELIDFALNKKMKEIWFVNENSIDEKIKESYNLMSALKNARTEFGYNALILGEYTVIDNLSFYLKRFNANDDEKQKCLEIKSATAISCKELSRDNVYMKSYINKAYNG